MRKRLRFTSATCLTAYPVQNPPDLNEGEELDVNLGPITKKEIVQAIKKTNARARQATCVHLIANYRFVSDRLDDEDSNATVTRYPMDIDAKVKDLNFDDVGLLSHSFHM
ncbi:hypothetical protein OS493_029788 [Desmophyllum pertusum]|uniref:Uncharacterized protein n=1 Tax=Desmophyllum pertusum TaxID=174260 RepID=A0A9X0CQR8_9CNID|nr:hypothetical protein OS493_029788 [Desmophyllum pertusum]